MEIETTETTTEESTQESTETQGGEDNNQAQAFKRMQEKNAELERKLAEKEEKKKTEEAKTEMSDYQRLKLELKEEMKADAEKKAKLNQVLTKYPQLSEHQEKIEKYLNDESRKGIPVDEVVAGAVGIGTLLKVGASIGSEALEQAENSKNGGGNATIETKTEAQKTEQRHMDSLPPEFR